MHKTGRLLLTTTLLLGMTMGAALGAGFQIPEQGIGPLSMGMGSVGLADDLSAVYHNPAGLTQLQGGHALLSLVAIMPDATYTRTRLDPTTGAEAVAGDTKADDDPIAIPCFAASKALSEKLTVAFAVNAPFGLSNEYDEDGVQRYMTTDISLTTVFAGPYLAWQATPRLSLGGGVQYVYGLAELGQHANYGGALLASAAALAQGGDGTLLTALSQFEGGDAAAANEDPRLDGVVDIEDATDNALSFNLGVLYKINDRLQLGATYRKGVDLDVEGDVTLEIPAAVTQFSGGLMHSLETKGRTTISLPDVVGLGVAYRPAPGLVLTSEIDWNFWSCYEDIDFDFAVNDALPDPSAHYLPDAANPRDWDDTMSFRLGARYQWTAAQVLRCGYLYDQSPIPDKTHGPELPMNDRNGVTLGYAMDLGRSFTLDLAYAHLFIADRTVKSTETLRGRDVAAVSDNNPLGVTRPSVLPLGDYDTSADIVGVSLSVAF